MSDDHEAISNHSLHSKQMLFEQKLEDHANAASEFRQETSDALKRIDAKLNADHTRFALLDQAMATMNETLAGIHSTIKEAVKAGQAERDKHDKRIAALESAAQRRTGAEGVWTLLFKQFGGWIAAAGAGIVAVVAWFKGG